MPQQFRGGDLQAKVGSLVLGVLFTMVGLGIIAAAIHSRSDRQRVAALRVRHPDSPWMWNPEWASGQIRGSAKTVMIVAWCAALFWNAIAWPVLPSILEQAAQKPLAWLGLVFPVVGIGIVGWAGLATLRARRFGTGTLTLETLPGVIGGRFAASVETGKPLPRDAAVVARLACVQRTTTGSGKSRSTHESTLWQHETDLAPGQLLPGMRGTRIPLAFEIPAHCHPTDERFPNQSVHWRVELRADLPGADYVSTFEVPVFRTAASPPR